MIRFLFIMMLTYILSIIVLYFMQRTLIYFPGKIRPLPVEGIEVVSVKTEDDLDLQAWYVPPKIEGKPVIVMFHGNGGSYGSMIYKAQYYLDAGYGALLAEYRGYSGNEGAPSELGLYQDGRAYIDWLREEKSIDVEDIVLYGESLGSGVAVQMATEYHVGGLVLEVPFSSLQDVAKQKYFLVPVDYLLKDRYLNTDKIGKVRCPLLIMHGQADSVIAYPFAEKLYRAANEPKEFVTFPLGDHNTLYQFGAYDHVLKFLSDLDQKALLKQPQ